MTTTPRADHAVVPVGEPCTLLDCPPGHFTFADMLCFRSEYSSGAGRPDAYCCDSGEYFWGGTKDYAARAALIVQPVELAAPRDLDAGRFAEWSESELAAQCRMQSRDNLDPEYSRFMAAVADRLAAAPKPAMDKGDIEADAADIVALHIEDWGWGPASECEGLAEHSLAVKACTAGIRYGLTKALTPAMAESKEVREAVARVARALAEYDVSGLRAKGIMSAMKPWQFFEGEAKAVVAALTAEGRAVERYRHVKRGKVYEVIGEAELQDAAGHGCGEGDRLTIYRDEAGKLWAREQIEFHDGRFAALSTPEER